jgi:hypothetical protein
MNLGFYGAGSFVPSQKNENRQFAINSCDHAGTCLRSKWAASPKGTRDVLKRARLDVAQFR